MRKSKPSAEPTAPHFFLATVRHEQSLHRDGCVAVPEGPGLGVTYDWKAIQNMATGKRGFKS
jgi:L-alanine-DL-glutamate epimerase-like enolase superfamily enzyme